MCGIAGVLQMDGAPVAPPIIRAMTGLIAHRGPDGEGHVVEGPVAIGHRRLAIIDLSDSASQPMESPDGR
jgi:asparagine synthase (glutamine-hydrolysing)